MLTKEQKKKADELIATVKTAGISIGTRLEGELVIFIVDKKYMTKFPSEITTPLEKYITSTAMGDSKFTIPATDIDACDRFIDFCNKAIIPPPITFNHRNREDARAYGGLSGYRGVEKPEPIINAWNYTYSEINSKKIFSDEHEKDRKSGFFGSLFTKTRITKNSSLDDIVENALRPDSRSRRVFIRLEWLTANGKVGKKCPQDVKEIIESKDSTLKIR